MVKKIEQLNPEFEVNNSEVSLRIYDEDRESYSYQGGSTDKGSNLNQCSTPRNKQPNNTIRQTLKAKGRQDDQRYDEPPIIFGDFTNWKGKKMTRLDDFVLGLARKHGHQNMDMNDDFEAILA